MIVKQAARGYNRPFGATVRAASVQPHLVKSTVENSRLMYNARVNTREYSQ